ncbi:DUF3352 domain-containing protein, partial [Escherichia coli]|nr:DUF3352 domain-containing protein [Escherichia coli]
QEVDYKGQKIIEVKGKGESFYGAVLGDRFVLSVQIQAVEHAIDTFQGEASFASKDGVDSLIAKGVDLKNTVAQIYLPDYA